MTAAPEEGWAPWVDLHGQALPNEAFGPPIEICGRSYLDYRNRNIIGVIGGPSDEGRRSCHIIAPRQDAPGWELLLILRYRVYLGAEPLPDLIDIVMRSATERQQ